MNSQLDLFNPDEWHPNTVALRERRRAEFEGDERAVVAAIRQRHREEWDLHLDLWNEALFTRHEGTAKLAKTLAETLRIRQADERATLTENGAPPSSMDAETRRRRIAELLKELGIGA